MIFGLKDDAEEQRIWYVHFDPLFFLWPYWVKNLEAFVWIIPEKNLESSSGIPENFNVSTGSGIDWLK